MTDSSTPMDSTVTAVTIKRDLKNVRWRLRNVGQGDTINGTYQLPPSEALDEFKNDLLFIVKETRNAR